MDPLKSWFNWFWSTPAVSRNVLVIGETGVGKSSLLKMLLGEKGKKVKTSSSVKPCTFTSTKYPYGNLCLVDTVGYNDVKDKPEEVVKKLIEFANEIGSEGISLVIYVMKKGKINAVSKKNYQYFVETFCQNQVPVLLVITHCEAEKTMGTWYSSQKKTFADLKMAPAGVVSGCVIDSTAELDPDMIPIYQRKKKLTEWEVRKNIEKLALDKPWKPAKWDKWIVAILIGLTVFGITLAVLTVMLPELVGILGIYIITALRKALNG